MTRMALLIAALAAGVSAPALANGGGHLWGSSWHVTALGEFEVQSADGVTIDFTDGRIAGRSGCNRYTGPVTLRADRIETGAIAGTRMACPGRAMEIERGFLGALDSVTHWRIAEDGALELIAEGARLIRAVAP